MKFSIICCTWNSADYLKESVESVLAQDHPDIEYIFVDGGSTDETLDLIAAIDRPVKILNDVRGGISRAMNEGIRVATGDIVAHLHSDDYYLEAHVLSRVASAFDKSPNKWLFGRIKSDLDGALLSERYEVPRYSFRRFLRRNFIPHPATFIRREVFEKCGVFSETLRYAMDYDLFLRIAKRYAPIQLDEHLTAFRRHDGSTTQANFMKSFREDYQVRCNHSRWYQLPEAALRYFVRRQRHIKRLASDA